MRTRIMSGLLVASLLAGGMGTGALLVNDAYAAETESTSSLANNLTEAVFTGFNQYATENGYTLKELILAYKEGRKPCNLDCEHQQLMKERAAIARKQAQEKLAEQKAAAAKKAADEAAAKKAAEEAAAKQDAEQQAADAAAQQNRSEQTESHESTHVDTVQEQPASSEPVNHKTSRDCYTNDWHGTAACQSAVDAGGLVWIETMKVQPGMEANYGITDGNKQWWFLGHNSTEGWILNVKAGDTVRINGQDYKAGEPFRINQNASYPVENYKNSYYLQTCDYTGGTMVQIPIYPLW